MAALLLAATFVVLALVVNSAIFSQNLSTRDDVAGSQEVLEYRGEVVDNVERTMLAVNENADTTHDDLRNRLQDNVADIDEKAAFQEVTSGGLVSVEYVGDTEGARIAQDDPERNLTSVNQEGDWTLAEDVDGVRNVQFNFTHVDDDSETSGIFDASIPAPFEMTVDGPDGSWSLTVYRQYIEVAGEPLAILDDVDIITEGPDGQTATCTRYMPVDTDHTLSIDVTGATANGEFCPALDVLQDEGDPLWLGAGVDTPYDIDFETGGAFNGTYSMVVGGSADTTNLATGQSDDLPYATNAIYDLSLDYEYFTSAVGYESTIRVAPEEPPP